MEKQYLSEEQMRNLINLGMNTNDASMSIDIHRPSGTKEILWGYENNAIDVFFDTIPIYTLADLIQKLPKTIKKEQWNFSFSIEYVDTWYVSYVNVYEELISFKNNILIDALYQLLLWCINKAYI